MAISERDLKVLWGRAAGRCSICKIQVTADKQTVTDAFPFGESAHIIAEKIGGPRGDAELPESLRNSYLNLILLCPTCHTKIDKAQEDFPVKKLLRIKSEHEFEMAQLHPPDKDNYDEFLQFSRVTEQNWLAPDRKNYVPFGVTKEQWIAPFLEPRLETFVPRNVIRAFEVARACMIYSWYFYPLATLGLEQVFRVGKFAVRERSRLLQPKIDNFEEELKVLVAGKIISPTDERRWLAVGGLTGDRAFLAGATLCDPGQAINTLQSIADLINDLFSELTNQQS
jgi:hypothetical protein